MTEGFRNWKWNVCRKEHLEWPKNFLSKTQAAQVSSIGSEPHTCRALWCWDIPMTASQQEPPDSLRTVQSPNTENSVVWRKEVNLEEQNNRISFSQWKGSAKKTKAVRITVLSWSKVSSFPSYQPFFQWKSSHLLYYSSAHVNEFTSY